MRPNPVRHPPQQHDRDVALAAFELSNLGFRNPRNLWQLLSRHAAQRAHGADTLAELGKEAGFGIGMFGHFPCSCSCRPLALSGKQISLKPHRSRLPFDCSFLALTSALIRSAMKSTFLPLGSFRATAASSTMRATFMNRGLQHARMA